MKARTKLQHLVTELSEMLPRITPNEEQWAYKECLPHLGYANKSNAFCLDCGETFSLDLIKRKRATCPHCQTKLNIVFTKKRTYEYTNYFAITHVVGDFQVVENFELIAYYKKGKPVKHFLHAILEDWILPNGKITKIGLKHNFNWCMDSWIGDWEIRTESNNYYSRDKYDVYARLYHPDSVFKPEYLKIGINHKLSGLNVIEAIKILPNNPKAETLLKAKQFSLLGRIANSYSSDISRHWPSIKICLRNKYIVKDASIWMDYLDLLRYFNKDLRNAKYVCPKDLKKQHDRLVAKKREIQRIAEQERQRQEAIKRQENLEKAIIEYVDRFQKFFDLEFKKGNISIKVLQSVDEFKEEGDELNHCVFVNEYYLREKSLILSAKVDGKRTETIEFLLDKMKIQQARGFKNNNSEYHNQIVALVKKNIPKIKKIVTQQSCTRAKKQAA